MSSIWRWASATTRAASTCASCCALHARGVRRLFVEGGGRTVSAFLRAGLLARLQVTIAPLLIGSGRPAVRLPGSRALADCLRAPHRVFRMGGDVLFELDFTAAAAAADALDATDPGLARIL
ncbi:MAG: dihydrofolate reductase family protein [Steroidobacteraceae bacterium]